MTTRHAHRILPLIALFCAAMLPLYAKEARPKLLDLGAHSCIACQKLAPILDKMKKEYAGVLDVQFIDVWKDPAAGKKYGIQLIPTQIFFDANGKELFRHVGFYSEDDFVAKWKELGYDIKAAAAKDKTGKKPAAKAAAGGAGQ